MPKTTEFKERGVRNPLFVDVDGELWIALPYGGSAEGYQNLALNVQGMFAAYEERLAQLEFLQRCISEFNRRAAASKKEI